MRITLVILLTLFCHVLSFEFEDAGTDGVEFVSSAGQSQKINIQESNEVKTVNLVLLTGVFDVITVNYAVADDMFHIKEADGPASDQKYLTIDLVDYEVLVAQGMQKIIPVDVIVGGDISNKKSLSLEIINIDDENPTLTNTGCDMDENLQVTVDNGCEFTVGDKDGWLSSMTFTVIDGTREESSLFEFKYKEPPADDVYETTVYLVLKDKRLDYEDVQLYTFRVKAEDKATNPTKPLDEIPVLVQVNDKPDMPPVWDSTFKAAISIDEETETTIQVSAKDGDFGINNAINYDLEDKSGGNFANIDNVTGLISIQKIDRDKGGLDQVTLSVTAYEVEDPNSLTKNDITLIINDIDDNIPLMVTSKGEKKIEETIDENSNVIGVDISASDIDLGENALYNVALSAENKEFLTAFTVIPSRGYENTTLSLQITDPSKLDYENADWIEIKMTLTTTGSKTPSNQDVLPITITLNDINDEFPVFDNDLYEVEIPETLAADKSVANIKATDKDKEDIENGLKHEILGAMASSILHIEPLGGEVKTTKDGAFDYEKQSQIIVQIQATDLANNRKTAQLTINVLDVNDEKPRLVVSAAEIPENSKEGTVLETTISASDEDGTANLTFTVDWDNSYATKSSVRVEDDVFKKFHCIKVETVPDPDSNKQATAKLSIIETVPDNTPDYEVFDTLYLKLTVTDLNQDKNINENTDSALVVINIQNENDNPPVFRDGTETESRQVNENAEAPTVITSVVATDRDLGDEVTYSIEPADADTPKWVKIDPKLGTITVYLEEGDKIDCDEPNLRDNVKYNVTATDGKFPVTTTITIDIIDQNENGPTMDNVEASISEQNEDEDESPNGTVVVALQPKDIDRDSQFRTVVCSMDASTPSAVNQRFQINDKNEIVVKLEAGVTLDRDGPNPSFSFNINCRDNPTNLGPLTNSITKTVNIILEDINDNKPTISNVNGVLNENIKKGRLEVTLEGDDKDSPENGNGLIEFIEITQIKRYLNKDDDSSLQDDPPQDLFTVETDKDQKTGLLNLNVDSLEGYYGYLVLTVSLTDKGQPALTNSVEVTVEVAKYNFKEPLFTYPVDGETIYLSTVQDINTRLIKFNDDPLGIFEVDDQQNKKYEIIFNLPEDSNGLFNITAAGELRLKSLDYEEKSYPLVVQSTYKTDNQLGDAPFVKNCTFNVYFFNLKTTDPVFKQNDESHNVDENSETTVEIPLDNLANYTQPGLPPEFYKNVFYILTVGDESLFSVDKNTGTITVLQKLDYEQTKSYDLVIQSSHSENLNTNPVAETKLAVTINVNDLNDNLPVFEKESYTTTVRVVSGSPSTATLVQVTATDLDENDVLTYSIDSCVGSNDKLNGFSNPFKIDKDGNIVSNFNGDSSLTGFFTCQVTATDLPPESHIATATVKIYLVTNENLVQFTFENDQESVAAVKDQIKEILDENFKAKYNYATNVEDPTQGQSDDESPRTIAPCFFLDLATDAPVEGKQVYNYVSNAAFFRELKSDFMEISLLLLSFTGESTANENLEDVFKAWLIGISVVLGCLCLILAMAFILKTRSLNQRIDKLSNTKFGSQESGLNRAGVANAPTTNKHAIEGSNPVYNNEVDTNEIDRRNSVTSGDSDLIGVEDDDKFGYGNNISEKIPY